MKKLEEKWRRLTAGAVAVLAALGLTACGTQTPANEAQDKKPVEENSASTNEDVWIGWPDFGEEGIVLPDDVWE